MNCLKHLCAVSMMALGLTLTADVPEFAPFVPQEKGYEIIFKANPAKFKTQGYTIDNSDAIEGQLTRLAYFLKLTDKNDKVSWVFISMDPFSQNLPEVGIPEQGVPVHQEMVNNLEIASNVPSIVTGKIPQGNIEFWPFNYGPKNSKNIPGANNNSMDFGDDPSTTGGYTSMQVCNYAAKQVIFAFNNVNAGDGSDLGIGNNTSVPPAHNAQQAPNPDWTFAANGGSYKDAELIVAGKFNNFKLNPVIPFKSDKVYIVGRTDKNTYAVNEPIVFTLDVDFADQTPKPGYFIQWNRRGDDGKTDSGKVMVDKLPFSYTTALNKPGFLHISAKLFDHKGRLVKKSLRNENCVFFEGGIGVDTEKLQGTPEPEDFDEFWAAQKAKLNAIPFNPKNCMTELPSKDPAVKIYAVKVPCLGPRPVTGYLTIPANAKAKSLPAGCSYHGYSTTSIQRAPSGGSHNSIQFNVNAHGYELGQPDEYYKEFYRSIMSNGKSYAFDPVQNAKPETAYFYGMALRVMRSLQFVMALPEWNGKDLSASGGSQGGLQTIWAAGFEPKVTRANSGITWCCDLGGQANFNRIHGGWRVPYTRAIDYFDTINVAKRIPRTCKVFITRAGLGDYTCPPSGLAILYNNIKAPKAIYWVQGSTHGFVPPFKNNQSFTIKTDDYDN